MPKRKPIEPHTPVRVEISIRESELIREHCFLAVDLLRSFNRSIHGKTLVAMLTLDDIEDFIDDVAAAGNHAENREVERALDALYERLLTRQRSYDDGNWNDSESPR